MGRAWSFILSYTHGETQSMIKFVTALTLTPSDIRKIRTLLRRYKVPKNPLQHLLITPLFAHEESLGQIRELSEKGASVTFDSGGYYVQIGRLEYYELYYPLLEFYKDNDWADIYTLPDHVPTTQDAPEDVWIKVQETVDFSRLFFWELPSKLQQRAMPVVHGHTYEQVDYCLEHYIELGVRHLGFGSFGTFGKNSEVNVTTESSIDLARHVIEIANSYDIAVHLFGLGAPALVPMISSIGASSFDSSSWIKAAGFGQVFLPFMRAYNISHRNGRSELQKGITVRKFEQLKDLTGHYCPFCEDIDVLQQEKIFRTMHNLISIDQTITVLNNGEFERIKRIYQGGSPGYREEYDRWLA